MNAPGEGIFYPSTEIHDGRTVSTYLLTNPEEFFAVTASVYLWGHVDREPHDAARLKAIQPIYYAWLGQLFGTDGAAPPSIH